MADEKTALLQPVHQADRIIELDVFRGIALFGVLVMNFVAFAGADILATKAQFSASHLAQVSPQKTSTPGWWAAS